MWKLIPVLVLTAGVTLLAQRSPFDGTWVAEVPMPDGPRVPFSLVLRVNETGPVGTIQIGESKPVPIQNGRLRGDVLSFRRNLGEDEGAIMFLARVMDDGLHVGFMQRPPEGAPPSSRSSRVINFIAKRVPAH